LFGYILGDIHTGLWLGMIVEMMWINAIPMGVSVPVDLTMMTSLAVIWGCSFFQGSQEAAIFALALAVPFAYLYKEVDLAGRLFNTKIMHWVEKGVEQGYENRISKGIYLGLLFFFVRTAVMYGLLLFFGGLLYKEMFSYLPIQVIMSLKKAWYYLPVFGFGAVLYNFKSIKIPFIKKQND
jgi:mannose/fructose/N-acetylgalactosamine-specific phosphotransferase system component IIC